MKKWSVQNDNMSYMSYYCNSKSTFNIVCSGFISLIRHYYKIGTRFYSFMI